MLIQNKINRDKVETSIVDWTCDDKFIIAVQNKSLIRVWDVSCLNSINTELVIFFS